MESSDDVETWLTLVRHGDRFDYANPKWCETISQLSEGSVVDPPLSRLGHSQASETADAINQLQPAGFDMLLCSPYLRCIQTAVPSAELFGLSVCIEPGLAETHHDPLGVPGLHERFRYFPQVNLEYASIHDSQPTPGEIHAKTGNPCESYPVG